MSFKIIIPARYASSRLPGKPLVDIAGKPMIQHVYERACESDASRVMIATDDERIRAAAEKFDAEVCMTSTDHRSGTDRLAEVVASEHFDDEDIVINVQGDEPCLPAALINQVAQDLIDYADADMASLYTAISSVEEVFDPNVVKVVMDKAGYALYFSRAPIPWMREAYDGQTFKTQHIPHNRHIGLYGYRTHFLRAYHRLPPAAMEQHESLEQLRVLFNGKKIHMSEATIHAGHGVDTEADLAKVRQVLAN